jgi:hypothetical protein
MLGWRGFGRGQVESESRFCQRRGTGPGFYSGGCGLPGDVFPACQEAEPRGKSNENLVEPDHAAGGRSCTHETHAAGGLS